MNAIRYLLSEFRALRISLSLKFVIGTAIVLILALSLSTYFILEKDRDLIMEQLDIQAKTLFSQIVLTRRWISDHGGIFVEKFPWKQPNPYLAGSEMTDISGKRYLKESPAMVTKELSQYAREQEAYWFHITSLKLINPENAPDAFERDALMQFEQGSVTELSKTEKVDKTYFYRYIAPLYIEKSCLQCHSHQGYRVGDVRGAISVSIPMSYTLSMLGSEKKTIIIASAATVGILMLVLFVMMQELVLRPVRYIRKSMEKFSKGEDTGFSLLRTGDELEDLNSSFLDMSKSLSEYHERLEAEVQSATRSFQEANRRLAELNEKKSDFIAKISHELRTPMTAIHGAMDYISARIGSVADHGKNTGDLKEFLEVIRQNAVRITSMVSDTLDLERIESGMFDLQVSEADIVAIIKEVIISFQSLAAERNISFQIAGPRTMPVHADEDRIRQVLINLFSNAIHFSPDNGKITCDIKNDGETVTVVIRDEGPGIPVELRKKIFDKFYTVGKRKGTGLGLAICKGIIEAHRGEIGVMNDVANGSALYFRLPADGGPEA